MRSLLKLGNPFVKFLLRSPFHWILSKNTLLITFLGWKSGNFYTTPTNYVQDGETVWLTSARDRICWRNMIGGAAVTLRLRGKNVKGKADAYRDEKKAADGLTTIFKTAPNFAKYFKVTLDKDGQPNPTELAEAAKTRVVVEIKLSE